jgi:hypothetical protein
MVDRKTGVAGKAFLNPESGILSTVVRMGFVIYLDHNATTPVLTEVSEAMMPYLTTE